MTGLVSFGLTNKFYRNWKTSAVPRQGSASRKWERPTNADPDNFVLTNFPFLQPKSLIDASNYSRLKCVTISLNVWRLFQAWKEGPFCPWWLFTCRPGNVCTICLPTLTRSYTIRMIAAAVIAGQQISWSKTGREHEAQTHAHLGLPWCSNALADLERGPVQRRKQKE
jgi:hypothetical protein